MNRLANRQNIAINCVASDSADIALILTVFAGNAKA